MVEIINKYYQCECCGKQFDDKQFATKHESEHIKLVGLKKCVYQKDGLLEPQSVYLEDEEGNLIEYLLAKYVYDNM